MKDSRGHMIGKDIVFKTCKEVDMDIIYRGFMEGFSDYHVPMTMKQETFIQHFFTREGNQLENSFIGLFEGKAVGIILGGIRPFDGIKTLRCGALAVIPEYRGMGIGKQLYELHKLVARKEQCKQLCLEVLWNNQTAISLYEKLGYVKTTILKYYSINRNSFLERKIDMGCKYIHRSQVDNISNHMECHSVIPDNYVLIEERDHNKIINIINSMEHHVNWQLDTPMYSYNENRYICMYHKEVLIGLLVISSDGRIMYLWVKKDDRNQGIATCLLTEGANRIKSEKIQITVSSNPLLEGYIRKLEFEKQEIMQYEMIQPMTN